MLAHPASTHHGRALESGKALEKLLKSTKKDVLDLQVTIGEQRKKCRLVAIRAEKTVARKRRAERRKQVRAKGKQPGQKALIRDGWHIMLTNLEKENFTVAQLAGIYRSRWAVEIQFRAWKQALNLSKALNRKSNEHHLQALVLAGMIAHQLGMRVGQLMSARIGRARLSYERLYDTLAGHLAGVACFMEALAFSPDPRHISRNKRTTQSPIESALQTLT